MKQLDKVFERTLAQNLRGLNSTSVAANKLFGETQMQQAFIVNIDSQGYTLPDNDMAELIFKAFITSVSTYLSKVKISKEDEAVVLELTDVSGNFKFAGIVEYHENETPDEPGNWSYTLTLNEDDVKALEKTKAVKKYLFGDEAFKTIFDKISYDIVAIEWAKAEYIYAACLIVVDTIVQVLDREAVEGEVVDIEIPGFMTMSVSVEDGEKVFALTPDGAMKAIIKDDKALEK